MNKDNQTRRDFLRLVGRGAAAAALAAVAGVLLWRRQASGPVPVCIAAGVCATCRIFDRCDLDAARNAREEHASPQTTRGSMAPLPHKDTQ